MLTGLMGWWPEAPVVAFWTFTSCRHTKNFSCQRVPWCSNVADQYRGKGVTTEMWWGKDLHSKKEEKKIAHQYQKIPGLQGKASPKRDLQKQTHPQGGSALKWGLREVQPGSTPYSHTAELPSPVLLGLTGSFLQVPNQCFRLGLNSSHTCTKLASSIDTMLSQSSPIPPPLHRAVSGLPSPSLRGLVLWLHFQLHLLLPPTQ